MANTQYLKYKNNFKKQCIYTTLGGAFSVIAVICLLFVRCFKMEVFGITVKEFSVLDELKLVFELFKSKGSYLMIFGFWQIFALVFITVAIGIYIYELVKNISGIMNMDNYALEQYDKIKMRGNDREKRFFSRFTSSNYFISGIIFEVLYIVMLKYIYNLLPYGVVFELGGYNVSYFAFMSGVSWTIMFAGLFFIAAMTMFILRKNTFNKTKMSILKEDYGLNETKEQQ